MGQRVSQCSKLKPIGVGVAKASLHRAKIGALTELSANCKLHRFYPKPGDLAMGRLKGR